MSAPPPKPPKPQKPGLPSSPPMVMSPPERRPAPPRLVPRNRPLSTREFPTVPISQQPPPPRISARDRPMSAREFPALPTIPNRSAKPDAPSLPPKPPPKPLSLSGELDSQTKRGSLNMDLEKHLSNRMRNSGGLLGSSLPPSGPPTSPPMAPPKEEKSKSKILRPTKKSGASKRTKMVYGTLTNKLMGGSSDSSKKNSDPSIPSVSTPISAPTPSTEQTNKDDSNVKWKRGAEAEAILKLLAETQAQEETKSNQTTLDKSTSTSTSVSTVESLDTSEIMKILGIEEKGIQLPKHVEGEEKALDPVTELQLTERNFIADLGLLMETFIKPVRNRELLPSAVIESMELNLDRVICLHRVLYQQFLSDSSVKGLASAFSDQIIFEMERLYTVYMGHYESAIEVFYDKRDTVANFRKFLKQRETLTDKSIPNLLVTPVQRVCKYELMLASIVKTLSKDTSVQVDQADYDLMNEKIAKLNTALQNVDHRRAAADRWDKLAQLETTLHTSVPIAKLDRTIIIEADTTVRVGDQEGVFKLVVFNDMIIRAKVPKRSKKGRLLDSIPLSQLFVIDIKPESVTKLSSDTVERYPFIIASVRGDIWTVYMNTDAEKILWISTLSTHVFPFERFCNQWRIPYDDNQVLLGIDQGRWPQEYVRDCVIFITSTHVCVMWKMFGSIERDKFPVSSLINVHPASTKERTLSLGVSGWKRNYTFTSMQNFEHTEMILQKLYKSNSGSQPNTKPETDNAPSLPVMNSSYTLPDTEWDALWENANTRVIQPHSPIQQNGFVLYKLVKGQVIVKKLPQVILSNTGTVFGVSAFLEGCLHYPLFSSSDQVQLLELSREVVFSHLQGENLTKFFASLALLTGPV